MLLNAIKTVCKTIAARPSQSLRSFSQILNKSHFEAAKKQQHFPRDLRTKKLGVIQAIPRRIKCHKLASIQWICAQVAIKNAAFLR
jgi:hypothetical protein